ncbi:MAG: Plectin 1 [Myxococcaceae bacterium]|nr:Plectin 1 [Myxococcaceae bacterium]
MTPPRVRVARALTSTPLARRHRRAMGELTPAARAGVRFASFDRAAYPQAALELAATVQRALAAGEYAAVDLFAKIASALTLVGAPLDLVSAASRVPADEIRHTDLALRMAAALSDDRAPVTIDASRYAYLGANVSLELLDRAMLETAALGETLACALLGASHDGADDPVVRAHFALLLRDEIHHARLGWYYLAWRATAWSLIERQRVADHAGELVLHTEGMFCEGREAPRGAARAARALGVLDTKTQRAAILRVMEEEILPGLDGLGLGASHAWRARPPLPH